MWWSEREPAERNSHKIDPLTPTVTMMGTPVKRLARLQTGLSRHLQFLTSGHSDDQPKITNDGLTRSGIRCFIIAVVPMWQQWAPKGF